MDVHARESGSPMRSFLWFPPYECRGRRTLSDRPSRKAQIFPQGAVQLIPLLAMTLVLVLGTGTAEAAAASARLVYIRGAGADECPKDYAVRAAVRARTARRPARRLNPPPEVRARRP
jgi:hypothetical protein